jgi:HSP90 family molecular chaperone
MFIADALDTCKELFIRITPDKENKSLSIGIQYDQADLINNLGNDRKIFKYQSDFSVSIF